MKMVVGSSQIPRVCNKHWYKKVVIFKGHYYRHDSRVDQCMLNTEKEKKNWKIYLMGNIVTYIKFGVENGI